jgi:hypothetical protein
MGFKMFRTIWVMSILILFTRDGMPQQGRTAGQIATVNFCDLLSNPERYDKKIIRTTAIYETYYHGTFLYKLSCKSADANINAEFTNSSQFKTSSIVERQLEKVMSHSERTGAARANVTVVGRFNNWNGFGYGHLDSSRFQFDVMSFESAKSVPASTPWNNSSHNSESFMETVNQIKCWLDVQWNFAYLSNDAGTLEGLLPDDYVLRNEQLIVLNRSEVISLANRGGRVSEGSSVIDEHRVFINGSTAEVTGRATLGNCKNIKRQYRFSNLYSRRNANWEISSSRIVSVAPVVVPDILPCH